MFQHLLGPCWVLSAVSQEHGHRLNHSLLYASMLPTPPWPSTLRPQDRECSPGSCWHLFLSDTAPFLLSMTTWSPARQIPQPGGSWVGRGACFLAGEKPLYCFQIRVAQPLGGGGSQSSHSAPSSPGHTSFFPKCYPGRASQHVLQGSCARHISWGTVSSLCNSTIHFF